MGKWGPLRWATPGELRRAGVLGINRRNGDYVLPRNPREHYPRVDDKYLTKQICHAAPDPRAGDLRPGRAARRRAQVSRPDRPSRAVRHQAGQRQRGPRHHGHRPPRRPRVLQLQRRALAAGRLDLSPHDDPFGALFAGRATRPDHHRAADRAAPGLRAGRRRRHPRRADRALPLRARDGHGPAAHAGVAGPGQPPPGGRRRGRPPRKRAAPTAASARTAPSRTIPTPAGRSPAWASRAGKTCSPPP